MLGSADLESHYIHGYARAAIDRGQSGEFAAPLISHIKGNLYVGGCIHGARLPDDFRHVLSLYRFERYDIGPDTTRREVMMLDSDALPPVEKLREIATDAARMVADGKTLIHCQAGLNRSNLIAALVLRSSGLTSAEAIGFLRDRRSPVVLCNETFETWLLSLDDEAVA